VPTTTIHYVPILAITVISGILTVFISAKIGSIVTNPTVYLDASVQSAAEGIAMVCDGKLNEKALSPPPPGASYIITTCLDANAAAVVSTAITAVQLYGAVKEAPQMLKSLKNLPDTLKAFSKKIGDYKIAFSNVMSGDLSFKEIKKFVDEMSELADNAADVVDAVGDAGRNIDNAQDAAKIAGKNPFSGEVTKVDDSKKLLSDEVKSVKEQFSSDAFKNMDENQPIDCVKFESLCKQIQGFSQNLDGMDDALKSFGKTLGTFLNQGENVQKLAKGLKATSFMQAGAKMKLLTATGHFANFRRAINSVKEALTAKKYFPTKTLKTFGKIANKLLRMNPAGMGSKMQHIWMKNPNLNGVNDYIYRNSGMTDIIMGAFTGVAYDPVVVNIINSTSEDVVNMSKDSLNVSGSISKFVYDFREESSLSLASNRYYQTSMYVNDLTDSDIFKNGGTTTLSPVLFISAVSEFAMSVEETCNEIPQCPEYFSELVEKTANMSTGDTAFPEFWAAAMSPPAGIELEFERFSSVLEFLNEKNLQAEKVMASATEFYIRVGNWMKENCETEVVEVEEFGQVELANCGIVIDCSPQEFCYTGIPVVNPEVGLLYMPTSYLEGEDLETAGNLVGLKPDSVAKVVRPGIFVGICTQLDMLRTAYICSAVGEMTSCRVVKCGKLIKIEPNNFNPSVTAEKTDADEVMIGGNFRTW
jgi:hypothetical protein